MRSHEKLERKDLFSKGGCSMTRKDFTMEMIVEFTFKDGLEGWQIKNEKKKNVIVQEMVCQRINIPCIFKKLRKTYVKRSDEVLETGKKLGWKSWREQISGGCEKEQVLNDWQSY